MKIESQKEGYVVSANVWGAPATLGIISRQDNFEIEIFPGVVLRLEKKPSLWVRFGMFMWFGLRVRELNK